MYRILNIVAIIALICIVIATVGGLVWGNGLFTKQNPGGLDFLVPWSAARTFLEYGISPYDDSASQRTQILYYGRIADEGKDPLQLALPFPALLFYFPFAFIKNYVIARAVWMVFLEAALAVAAIFSVRLVGERFPFLLKLLCVLFSMLWVHAILPLVGGKAAVFTLLFITAGLYILYTKMDEFSGMFFALAAFSPRITGIFLVFIFWWIIVNHRWRILTGAGMTLGLLLLMSFLFMPGWVMPFIRAVFAEYSFLVSISTFSILREWSPGVGPQLAWILTIITVILFFIEWYASRRKENRHFLWTASITLALTPLLGLPANPVDYVVFLLPLMLILAVLSERWSPRNWGFAIILLLLFFAGLWGLVWGLLFSGLVGMLRPFLFFAVPILCIAGLYWVRWWAIRTPRTWIERVKGTLS